MNNEGYDLKSFIDKFLELQYGDNIAEFSDIQIRETRKAFVFGIGYMMFIAKEKLSKLDEEIAVNILQNLHNEICVFFDEEVKYFNLLKKTKKTRDQ